MAEFLVVQNVDLDPPEAAVTVDPEQTCLGLTWGNSYLLLSAATPQKLAEWLVECAARVLMATDAEAQAADTEALVEHGKQQIAEDPAVVEDWTCARRMVDDSFDRESAAQDEALAEDDLTPERLDAAAAEVGRVAALDARLEREEHDRLTTGGEGDE